MSDKIQKYIDNEMTFEEKTVFEAQLELDPNLQYELKQYKAIRKAIIEEGMQVQLEQIHQETFGKPKNKTTINWWYILIPILAGVLVFTMMKWKNVEPKTMQDKIPINMQFASAMKPLQGLPVTLSVGDDIDFREGMIAYRQSDYSRAAEHFDKVYQSAPVNDTICMYLANTYLALNRYEEADELLSYVSEKSEGNYYASSLYYLLKSKLMQNQKDQVKSLAKKLTTFENPYQTEALEILSKLM